MKAATILAVTAIAVSPCVAAKDRHASSFWERMFAPKPKPTPKKARPKKKREAESKPKPKAKGQKMFTVDNEWMAHYWTLVYEWDYRIPEERDIRYSGGQFQVPAVVYRHFEDMMEAKKE